jgi:hypothetical protein
LEALIVKQRGREAQEANIEILRMDDDTREAETNTILFPIDVQFSTTLGLKLSQVLFD